MIALISLIGAIAIIGMIVWFVTTLKMDPIFKNLIYLFVGVVAILFIVHAVQLGHIPSIHM